MLMIVRRDVASQAIGFFALENGVSLASLVVAAGLPLILEVAFLFDLLVAVVVFGVLIRVQHEQAISTPCSPGSRSSVADTVRVAAAALPDRGRRRCGRGRSRGRDHSAAICGGGSRPVARRR